MTNTNTNYTKLTRMPYAQAEIKHVTTADHDFYILRSYNTDVAAVDLVTGWAVCSGTYSATTRRHISAFAAEIADRAGAFANVDYRFFKRCAERRQAGNINYTNGEFTDLTHVVNGAYVCGDPDTNELIFAVYFNSPYGYGKGYCYAEIITAAN